MPGATPPLLWIIRLHTRPGRLNQHAAPLLSISVNLSMAAGSTQSSWIDWTVKDVRADRATTIGGRTWESLGG